MVRTIRILNGHDSPTGIACDFLFILSHAHLHFLGHVFYLTRWILRTKEFILHGLTYGTFSRYSTNTKHLQDLNIKCVNGQDQDQSVLLLCDESFTKFVNMISVILNITTLFTTMNILSIS